MKKILLISNVSLDIEKIQEQNALLFNSAEELDCKLEIKNNVDVYRLLINNNLSKYDAVLFYDKDVLLAQKLENIGYKVFNSSKAIEICDSKAKTQICLEKNNLPTPKTNIIPLSFFYNEDNYDQYVDDLICDLGLPLIAKKWFGSWGEQVYLLNSREEIIDLIQREKGKELLFQEFIPECSGNDIRINVVNNQVVAAMKRKNGSDFRANISNGGTMEDYKPTQEEIDIALKCAQSVGCDFCGVDILQSNRGPLVCEINSNAHLINIYKCTGVNVGKLILQCILGKI